LTPARSISRSNRRRSAAFREALRSLRGGFTASTARNGPPCRVGTSPSHPRQIPARPTSSALASLRTLVLQVIQIQCRARADRERRRPRRVASGPVSPYARPL
jgi:hypothetical protein